MGHSFTTTPAASVGPRRIEFVVCNLGELVEADELPMLSSPTGEYGLVRTDTGEIVVADGEEFALVGDFLYRLIFAEPEAGLTYRYYVEALVDGVTYHLPRTTAYVSSAMLAIGRYTHSPAIEQAFGVDNVHKWLGVNESDAAADYALRCYRFIADAESEIDDLLRNGPCTVPFTTVPEVIRQIATNLAAVRIYEARGVVDMDPADGTPQHRLHYQAKWVERQIARIKSGQLRLSVENVTRHPAVIEDDD